MLIAFSVAPSGAPPTVVPADPSAPSPVVAPGAGVAADGGGSVAGAVADAVRIVRESGLPHTTDAMFTTVEGGWEECMDLVRRCCEAVGRHGERVSLVLKADIRTAPGRTSGELTGKLERLEAALERVEGEPGRGQ